MSLESRDQPVSLLGLTLKCVLESWGRCKHAGWMMLWQTTDQSQHADPEGSDTCPLQHPAGPIRPVNQSGRNHSRCRSSDAHHLVILSLIVTGCRLLWQPNAPPRLCLITADLLRDLPKPIHRPGVGSILSGWVTLRPSWSYWAMLRTGGALTKTAEGHQFSPWSITLWWFSVEEPAGVAENDVSDTESQ